MKALRGLLVAVAFAVLLPIGAASAGPLPGGGVPGFSIDASVVGGESIHLTPTLVANPDGTFSAVGNGSAASFSLVFNMQLNPDPEVKGSFTLTNLSGSPQNFSVSATLSVLPVGSPSTMSGSVGDITFTDANNDNVLHLISALFYQARIDGTGVQDLGSFDSDA